MEIALQSTPFFQAVEYLAIFSCGMAGGLTAVRKRYDVSSIIIIAWITALGGGIIRDVLLGALPPVGISDMGSVLTAFAAGAVTAVVHPEVDRKSRELHINEELKLANIQLEHYAEKSEENALIRERNRLARRSQ